MLIYLSFFFFSEQQKKPNRGIRLARERIKKRKLMRTIKTNKSLEPSEVIDLVNDCGPKNEEIIDLSEAAHIDEDISMTKDDKAINQPLFFEDRAPNLSSDIPLYEIKLKLSETTDEMPKNRKKFSKTIKNNNNNKLSDLRSLLNKKLCNTASERSEPNISCTNVKISLQTAADKPSVFTRICTITSNSAQNENGIANKENQSNELQQSKKRPVDDSNETPAINAKRICTSDNDVILIDDNPDDSIVFVSETKIGTAYPANRIQTRSSRATRKHEKQMHLQALRKVNRIIKSRITATNPTNKSPDLNEMEKRMIIIDGSNVAFHHGASGVFSVKGIELCLQYFETRGFDVKAIVPQMRLRMGKSSDPKRLDKLSNDRKVILTPCKNLPGNRSSSYDDRFILEIAEKLDAAVISNDNYKDLLNQSDGKFDLNSIINYNNSTN